MRRESHVRSCESGRGRFPPATHQCRTLGSVRGAARKGGPYRNRPVLPVADAPPPPARQYLPEALGWEEVQAVAGLQAVQAVVGRADRATAWPVRPMAVGSCILTAMGERSRIKGDFYVRICGSRGLRCPGPPGVPPPTHEMS